MHGDTRPNSLVVGRRQPAEQDLRGGSARARASEGGRFRQWRAGTRWVGRALAASPVASDAPHVAAVQPAAAVAARLHGARHGRVAGDARGDDALEELEIDALLRGCGRHDDVRAGGLAEDDCRAGGARGECDSVRRALGDDTAGGTSEHARAFTHGHPRW